MAKANAKKVVKRRRERKNICLLYTSDAADEL